MFTVEDGTGLENSNSYATIEEATNYHALNAYGGAWAGYEDVQKQQALATATRYIDVTFDFRGYKLKLTQALKFPRVYIYGRVPEGLTLGQLHNRVPQLVKDATSALALNILTTNIEESAGSTNTGNISAVTVGDFRVNYSTSGSTTTTTQSASDELVTAIPRAILDPLILDSGIYARLGN